MAACVIGECARFGARLRTLTGQLGFAPAPATDREELRQAVAYIHAALADLLTALQPIHHEDLRRILSDRALGLVRCPDGCRPSRAATGAQVAPCAGCGGGACRSCGHPVPPDGPAQCWRCVGAPAQAETAHAETGWPDAARPGSLRPDGAHQDSAHPGSAHPDDGRHDSGRHETVRSHAPGGDLPWVATA